MVLDYDIAENIDKIGRDALDALYIELENRRKVLYLVNRIRILCVFGLIGLALTNQFVHVPYHMVIRGVSVVILMYISILGIRCDIQIRKIYQSAYELEINIIKMWKIRLEEETINEN